MKGHDMRNILIGLTIAAAAAAPAAAVQSVTITSAGIYNPQTLDATINGTTKSEYAAPLTLTGTIAGVAFDALGFCVDLPHNIYVNIGSQLQQTLNYQASPLTQDGYGTKLTGTQVREIKGLAALGFQLIHDAATDLSTRAAAIQQAIWTIEYPSASFIATGADAAARTDYVTSYLAEAPSLSATATNLVSLDGVQGQITNISADLIGPGGDAGPVPEPAVWLEMMAGFGAIGLLSRRRSSVRVVTA